MMKLFGKLYLLYQRIRRKILVIILKPLFKKHGKNFWFDPDGHYTFETISVGNYVQIGKGAEFIAAETTITIGNKVLFGPNVTIRGGNHNISEVGKFTYDVKNKKINDDEPVVIENDVWVGTRVIILKGARVGRGSVIAAGSVITKDIPPYAVVAGVPGRTIHFRWTVQEIMQHESALYPPGDRLSESYLTKLYDEFQLQNNKFRDTE